MNKIYIVSTCDNWKTRSSMNIEIAIISWKKVYSKVLELIDENRFEVGNLELLESCKNFPNNYQDINTTVQNIYIERFED